jgi:hypothetical protein
MLHPLDAASLGLAGVSVAALVVFSGLTIAYRKHSAVMRRDPKLTLLMAFSGMLHIGAVIIINRHIVAMGPVEAQACFFFNFFLPYAIGAGNWFLALYLRLWRFNTARSLLCFSAGAERARKMWWVIAILTLLPIWSITLLGGATGASSYSMTLERCASALWLKILVTAWASICAIVLAVSIGVFGRTVHVRASHDFIVFGLITFLGLMATVAVAVVILEDWLTDPFGRFIATLSVCFLYVMSVGTTVMGPVAVSVRGWRVAEEEEEEMHLETMRDFRLSADIVDDFLDYCQQSTETSPPGGRVMMVHDRCEVDSFYAVACMREIQQWVSTHESMKAHYPESPLRRPREAANGIIKKYLRNTSDDGSTNPYFIGTPDDLGVEASRREGHPEAFDNVEAWIFQQLDEYCGADYLNDALPLRPIWLSNRGVREAVVRVRREYARQRLGEAGLAARLPTPEDGFHAVQLDE